MNPGTEPLLPSQYQAEIWYLCGLKISTFIKNLILSGYLSSQKNNKSDNNEANGQRNTINDCTVSDW